MPFYDSSRRPETEYKRLQFLADLISLEGLKYDRVASMLGLQRTAIYAAFAEDDMSLSRAELIVDALGYEMSIALVRDGDDESDTPFDGKQFISTPSGYRLKRLAFLSAALIRYDISKASLAKEMGLAVSTVVTWFTADDIKFSRLFQVADSAGFSIKVRIAPKDFGQTSMKGRKLSYEISTVKHIALE